MKYYIQLLMVGTSIGKAINVGGTELNNELKKDRFLYDKWRAKEMIRKFKLDTSSDHQFADRFHDNFEVMENESISRHLGGTQGIHMSKVSKKSKSPIKRKNGKSKKAYNDMESKLSSCLAREATKESQVEWLWVQMSNKCTFEREEKSDGNFLYSVNLADVHPKTYGFGDRPSRQIHTTSSWGFTSTFHLIFGADKPNGAITYSTLNHIDGENVDSFESPMIGVFVELYKYTVGNYTHFSYELKQSENQENGFKLSSLFEGNSNLSRSFDHCSFFIDSDTLTPDDLLDSKWKFQPKNDLTKLATALNTVKKNPGTLSESAASKVMAMWRGPTDENGKKGFNPVRSAGLNAVNGMVSSIDKLNSAINNKEGAAAIAGSIGGMLLAAGTIAAMFGPVGAVLDIMGAVISIFASFYGPPSQAAAISISIPEIKDAIKIELTAEKVQDADSSMKSLLEDYDYLLKTATQYSSSMVGVNQVILDGLVKDYNPSITYEDLETNINTINAYYFTQMSREGKTYGLRSTLLSSVTDLLHNGCCPSESSTFLDKVFSEENYLKNCLSKWSEINFEAFKAFATGYINVAYKMWYYVSMSREILCNDSNCDCSSTGTLESGSNYYCHYKNGIFISHNLVYERVLLKAKALLDLLIPEEGESLSTLENACEISSFRFPQNQQCDSNSAHSFPACNFKYNVVYPCDYLIFDGLGSNSGDNQIRGGVKQFSNWEPNFWTGDTNECANGCQNDWNNLNINGNGAFWENIVHGITTMNGGDLVAQHLWQQGSCSDMCYNIRGFKQCILGVPNVCPLATCETLLQNEANFGLVDSI